VLQIREQKLKEIAYGHSLSILGTTDLSPFLDAEKPLKEWQKKGFAAEMAYMNRPAELLTHPQELCPEARSIIALCVNYDRGKRLPLKSGYGQVARYAWGRDYHKVLRRRLSAFVSSLEEFLGERLIHRVFSDSVPLLERAMAARAGLGFTGKNSMLIRYNTGSFFFISEVLSNLQIEKDKTPDGLQLQTGQCGSCTRCQDQCPTSAIVEDYRVDAGRCISYLTIEKRGAFDEWERHALGEWVFGCDICQEVCPFNHKTLKLGEEADLPELAENAGAGQQLDLQSVMRLRTHEQFVKTFSGTPIMRARREGLLRNSLVVAANTKSAHLSRGIALCLSEDPSAVVRQHALWALFNLESSCNSIGKGVLKNLLEKHRGDSDSGVSREAAYLLEKTT